MNRKRIPHQFVLALAFSVIAIGFSAVIIKNTTTALRQADDSIGYATAELQGIRYLSRTHEVLRELLTYRADLLKAQIRTGNKLRSSSTFDALSKGRIAAISASIAAIGDLSSEKNSLDDAIAGQLDALRGRWLARSSPTDVTLENVSAVVATIQPLLAAISGASGLSNDPSIDGINFGDAIIRFPLSLAYGSGAASIAVMNLAAANGTLQPRFSAARLLAQAQTAVEVGQQDAKDEMSVDPVSATPLARQAATNVRDFERMQSHVTHRYVESSEAVRSSLPDRALLTELDTFTSSSFAILDSLRQNLFRVTNARIEQARQQHWRLLLGTAGGVSLEIVLLLTLARISIVSFQNQRKRMAAERLALDSQRAELEVQLTHAKAQQALLRAKAQFRAVFDRAPTGMIIVDRQCKILDTNEAANAILQAANEPISAQSVILDHAPIIEEIFAGNTDRYSEERKYVDHQDRSCWFHVSISPVADDSGAAPFAIVMLRDVTDSKSIEQQLVFEAGHDALTGLPNRKCFLAMVQRALDDRRRDKVSGVFSVVFVDFNNFKRINDMFGHQAGDKFLTIGASRLRDSVRSTDIVARIGGDEFAMILYGTDRSEIENGVTRLQAVVSAPVNIEGQLVESSASFGIAQAELNYTLASEIIRDADTAMYQAKANGGRNYVVFEVSVNEKVALPAP